MHRYTNREDEERDLFQRHYIQSRNINKNQFLFQL